MQESFRRDESCRRSKQSACGCTAGTPGKDRKSHRLRDGPAVFDYRSVDRATVSEGAMIQLLTARLRSRRASAPATTRERGAGVWGGAPCDMDFRPTDEQA